MGLVVQSAPGSLRNGEPMTFGMGGSESNVAIGVRRLGLPATWIGRVGADPAGELILRELRAEQVQAITVTDPSPTGLMVRWRPSGAHGRVTYYRRHSAGSHLERRRHPRGGDPRRRGPARHRDHARPRRRARGRGCARGRRGPRRGGDRQLRPQLPQRAVVAEEAAPALEAAVRRADVVFAGELEAEIVTATADPLAGGAGPRDARSRPGHHQARRRRLPGAHRRRDHRAAGPGRGPWWTPSARATRAWPATWRS